MRSRTRPRHSDAQTFLTTAQVRLGRTTEKRSERKGRRNPHELRGRLYDIYCSVLEEELNALYERGAEGLQHVLPGDQWRRRKHVHREAHPSEGKLGLRGKLLRTGPVSPAAYHSEGHQDGMGVCLYLALMKRLFGDQFTFALLDDVVMSVDAGHRYEFCKSVEEALSPIRSSSSPRTTACGPSR